MLANIPVYIYENKALIVKRKVGGYSMHKYLLIILVHCFTHCIDFILWPLTKKKRGLCGISLSEWLCVNIDRGESYV